MASGVYGPGWNWCNFCSKWKADQAFVRSRTRRDTKLWVNFGFMWKKYKTCNRCARVYNKTFVLSVAEFVMKYGAEEHNE